MSQAKKVFENEPFEISSDLFQPSVLIVSLSNSTTKTKLEKGRWYFGNESIEKINVDASVQVVELLEDGLVIETPENIGAIGHTLITEISVTDSKKQISVKLSGKVTGIKSVQNLRESVHIRFLESDHDAVKVLNSFFETQQNQVDRFFKSAKG